MRSVAHGLDRTRQVKCDCPCVAGAAAIAERVAGEFTASAKRLDGDADGIIARGQHVTGLNIADISGIAAADGLQQDAAGTIAKGVDRAGQRKIDVTRGSDAGIADEFAADVTAGTANGLGDDAGRVIARSDDVAGLGIIDVAADSADGLQQGAE